MLENKQFAYAVLLVGVIAAVLAFAIDPLRGHDIYLHWTQIVALVVGIVLILAGAYLSFIRKPTV